MDLKQIITNVLSILVFGGFGLALRLGKGSKFLGGWNMMKEDQKRAYDKNRVMNLASLPFIYIASVLAIEVIVLVLAPTSSIVNYINDYVNPFFLPATTFVIVLIVLYKLNIKDNAKKRDM